MSGTCARLFGLSNLAELACLIFGIRYHSVRFWYSIPFCSIHGDTSVFHSWWIYSLSDPLGASFFSFVCSLESSVFERAFYVGDFAYCLHVIRWGCNRNIANVSSHRRQSPAYEESCDAHAMIIAGFSSFKSPPLVECRPLRLCS